MPITRPVITAGILATAAVVIFMALIPQLMGVPNVDMTQSMGSAFSGTAPQIAGIIFLALYGVLCATIFAKTYTRLPGNYLVKGTIYGILVGLFSLAVLPSILGFIGGLTGSTGYAPTALAFDNAAIVTLVAYVIFGLTLAMTYQPTETTPAV